MLGRLLRIVFALIVSSIFLDAFNRPEHYEPWYLATAQKMMSDDEVLHATRDESGDTLEFETPLMERPVAMAVVHSDRVLRNATKLGYHKFTFSNGTRTWTYDLQTKKMKPCGRC